MKFDPNILYFIFLNFRKNLSILCQNVLFLKEEKEYIFFCFNIKAKSTCFAILINFVKK